MRTFVVSNERSKYAIGYIDTICGEIAWKIFDCLEKRNIYTLLIYREIDKQLK